jgi:exopolyphosphatase/pppGpp-phosphohydrolase
VSIRIIPQEEEGNLGFASALAHIPDADPHEMVVYDSGGGSFQLTSWPRGAREKLAFNGPLGSTTVTVAMIEQVQKRSFRASQSPNPVTRDHLAALRGIVLDVLPSPPEAFVAAIARAGGLVVGIGEATSIFNIAALATGKMEYTSEDVWAAALRLIGRTDEQLAEIPQPSMVLPKLVLLYTVMAHVSCRRLRYQRTTGVCSGVLTSPGYWA